MSSGRVVVLGAGAWGTALALQAARARSHVTLWARDPARAACIAQSRRNPRLPDILLPAEIQVASGSLAGADFLESADLVLLAVPTQHLRAVLAGMARAATSPGRPATIPLAASSATPLAVCAKGIETGTLRLPLEIVEACVPGTPALVLTGPNFAREIAVGQPGAAVVAGPDQAIRGRVINLLSTTGFRLYGNDDPVGAQIGGAAKNVIAIAAGAVIGAGLGENARAALITRGLAELSRLVVALGGRAETVTGLSGLGDLLLTCTGPASRNYSLGLALGQGRPLAEILGERTSVTEGVATAPALVARANGLDLPVCGAVAMLLAGRITLSESMAGLLARPLRDE